MNEKQKEKKLHIIRHGLRALYRKGYNATGVKEITDAAGIPKGSFYNYFSSKEDMAIEAMEYFTQRELESMENILTDKTTAPLKRIDKLYAAKIEHFVNRGDFSFGCFLCNMTLEMADVNEAIAQAASDAFTREYQPIINCFEEAVEKGDLPPDCDIQQLTDLLRNAWLGALVIMKATKSDQPLRSFQQTLRNTILKNQE